MNLPHGRGVPIVATVLFATAISVGTAQYAFSLFIEPLEATFGWTRTQISASLSFAAVSGLASPLIGRAMDRFGARPILALSLLVMGVSFLLRPLMSELWHWYALSFLQFIAFAGATVLPAGKLVAAWFPRSRGRVLGIAAMGNNVGGLVMPPAIVAVLAVGSWQQGYLALAGVSFALAGLGWLIVRESPPAGAAKPDAAQASIGGSNVGFTVREAVRLRSFYAVGAAFTLGSFTYSTVLPHVLVHLTTEGMTLGRASFSLGTLALGGLTGKLLFGWLSERFGSRRATIVNLSGQATFAIVLSLASTPLALMLAVPAFGIFMGGFGVPVTLLVQDAFGLRYFGSIMGLLNMNVIISFGFGPLIAGFSYDLTGGYTAAFIVAAAFFAIGALTLALVRVPVYRAPP